MVEVNTLPPTTGAAENHSERAFLQVQEWLERQTSLIRKSGIGFVRMKNSFQLQCLHLLHQRIIVIRCSYKTNCESRRCNCRKHGLHCSIACGECRGISCSNAGEDKNNEEFFISDYVKNYLSDVLVNPKCIIRTCQGRVRTKLTPCKHRRIKDMSFDKKHNHVCSICQYKLLVNVIV